MSSIRKRQGKPKAWRLYAAALFLVVASTGAQAFQANIDVQGEAGLGKRLRAVSLIFSAQEQGKTSPQDILAAARADYRRLLGTLYETGHFGAVISIRADGREVSALPPFDLPSSISQVRISVIPGPLFRFGSARVSPLSTGTVLPGGFAPGQPAGTAVISEAASAAVSGWRENAHALARISGQKITANHRTRQLNVAIQVAPGPALRFGPMKIEPGSAVRDTRIRQIAGYPQGTSFSPKKLEQVANRLRKTGAFRSVVLKESKSAGPGNTLSVSLGLVDQKPRRIGFGGELSSREGAALSAYWLHRNAFGGAERLRFDAEIRGIGGTNPPDYRLAMRLERPGSLSPFNTGFLAADLSEKHEPQYTSRSARLEIGVDRTLSERASASIALAWRFSDVTDALGHRQFSHLMLPVSGRYDGRDDMLDPQSGIYLGAEITPFFGLNGSASGVALNGDARGYFSPGGGNLVFAGRMQIGSVLGASLGAVPPEMLFASGGGGTVRGQPYKSLDVDLGGGLHSGGRSFLALSAEARLKLGKGFSFVAFADEGFVGAGPTPGRSGRWHGGAGLGLRYETGLGPIRFDVAVPTNGPAHASGIGAVQFYIGIGQAF